MKKLFGVLVLTALLVPAVSSAATITNVEFSNGDVEIQGTGGTTVNATFRVEVPFNEVVEFIQLDPAGDNLGPVDHSVGGNLGLQEGTHFVKLGVKLPPNTGFYDLDWQTAGIYGGQRAINGDDAVNGGSSFGSALRVVANASGSTNTTDTGNVGGMFGFNSFAELVTALKSAFGIGGTPASSPTNPKCAAIAPYTSAASFTYSSLGVQLQSALLMDDPNSIPALRPGSMVQMGYRGEQTNRALANYNAKYGCI